MPCPSPSPGPVPARFARSGALSGTVSMPGDKSISHRALMLAALAVGTSRIDNLLEGEDVAATAAALRALGATITRDGPGSWRVDGVGVGGLLAPSSVLDLGNSGTSARLLMGLLASHAITATFAGDASLSARPMGRVAEPLALMGAEIIAHAGAQPSPTLPLTLRGLCPALPISYRLPVASAQVKTAILLAALNTPGTTTVIEPIPTRDHGERMLAAFGADLSVTHDADGARRIELTGPAELTSRDSVVPGDISSAAFLIVAALIVPGSAVTITGVGLNPTRTGLLTALDAMGAGLAVDVTGEIGGEPVGDITVRHRPLTGAVIDPELAPLMIDEYPALFVAAAFARGTTIARGAAELRVKESDRIAAMADALGAIGVTVEVHADGLSITGTGTPPAGGATVAGRMDHRICMALAVAGLATDAPVTVDDMRPVATSFPTFQSLLTQMGAPSCP